MPGRRDEPLLRASAFEVRIGDRDVGFAQVGPLASDTTADDGSGRPVHRYLPVVLRRALTRSPELYDWRRAIVEGKDDRRDVTIRQLSAPGGKPVNAWRLIAEDRLTAAEQLLQHRQVDGVEPDEDRRVAVVVGLGEDAA